LPDFQNPQQEPGTERRLLLVFALTFLIILASQPLLKKYGPKTPEPAPQTQNVGPVASPASPAEASAPPSAPAQPGIGKQALSEAETVVKNDLYEIHFTNRGGQVKSWALQKYKNEQGQPLELVNAKAADKYGYPLSLWSYDEALRNKLNSALYVLASDEPVKVEKMGGTLIAPTDVSFEYSDADVTVRKTFHFDDSYVVNIQTSVSRNGAAVAAFPMWPAGFGDEMIPTSYAASRVEYLDSESTDRTLGMFPKQLERLAIKNVTGGNTIHGALHWAGVTDQYFAAIFIPQDARNSALVTLRNSMEIPKDPQHPDPKDVQKVEVLGAAMGNVKGPTEQRLYVGPKDLNVLEKIPVAGAASSGEPDLRAVVDFGWLGYIARPLFLWLKWTYNHIVPNWGWAIVLQTLVINLLLSPLRFMQQRSALEMQRVAPQIKSIQEKYKKYSMGDPRKRQMQEEIAGVYKEHGVNPAAGCLPLLIQMPFLIAYYRMLGVALDLRFAHWLWIKDLSAFDPYYILPIFLVVSMFVMQRMTPMTGMDPAQQKMMMVMMPVMMGFIFRYLASGLNLYYAESNLISMIQQVIMNRTSTGQELRKLAEKRARKKEK
jgi:YidC/Oxa1 family membrane protein insertase